MTIGIIGQGYVGTAIKLGFQDHYKVLTYDKFDLAKSTHSKISDLVSETNIIFVCVPTPMRKDGTCYTGIVEEVIREINETANGHIVVIKSTIPPGTTDRINSEYTHSTVIFNPEFLTERSANFDFINQTRYILGGDKVDVDKVADLYFQRFMNRNMIKTDSTTAELIKYMNNTFFATKVSIMNEFKVLSDKIGTNWEDALHGFASDGRIGDSHLHVPGPDGKLGYGGTCFPKDVNALLTFAEENDVELNTIKGGWITNLAVRPEQDWKADKGRAVSDD